MQVTSKGTYLFHRTNKKANPTPNESPYEISESCHVFPTGAGQTQKVPDWVRDNQHFKLVAKDGNIQEVVVKKAKAPDPAQTPTSDGLTPQTSGFQQKPADSNAIK